MKTKWTTKNSLSSWGGLSCSNSVKYNLSISEQAKKIFSSHPQERFLTCGLMRSYGDSCLIDNGILINNATANHFVSFDKEKKVIEVEGGVSFDQILRFSIPLGLFLPVTPGTKFITVAGAIANDIHGKNHHQAGTFGRFIKELTLVRTSGEIIICSLNKNTDLFKTTIGGLGLTGFIKSAKIELISIDSSSIIVEHIPFKNFDEFLEIDSSSKNEWPYIVSWIDSTRKDSISGIYMRGKHLGKSDLKIHSPPSLSIPFYFPRKFLNKYSVSLFNNFYYLKESSKGIFTTHYDPFFYPLDKIHNWNRIYGRNGFLQFQCVLPKSKNNTGIKKILKLTSASGSSSFLSVLKQFGNISSPGLLSFPMEGLTICLDFPNRGEKTKKMFYQLFDIVKFYKGRVYPAKDYLMRAKDFSYFYPQVKEFRKFIDPQMTSCLWERVKDEK